MDCQHKLDAFARRATLNKAGQSFAGASAALALQNIQTAPMINIIKYKMHNFSVLVVVLY